MLKNDAGIDTKFAGIMSATLIVCASSSDNEAESVFGTAAQVNIFQILAAARFEVGKKHLAIGGGREVYTAMPNGL